MHGVSKRQLSSHFGNGRPDYETPAGGKLTMRRKTVGELRFQALGSKNEKNLGSGQLPTYLDSNMNCSIPAVSRVTNANVNKKQLSLPQSTMKDRIDARFKNLSHLNEMRVYKQPSPDF